MSEEPDAIAKLELWQFSLRYEDLPYRNETKDPVDNGIYRSKAWPRYVFVFHKPDVWDPFVWRP